MAATEAPTAANAADLDEKSKRVRSLLSSYYGTPQAPGSAPSTPTSTDGPGTPASAGPSPAAAAAAAPKSLAGAPSGRPKAMLPPSGLPATPRLTNIDSATFDAERYLQQLLKQTRLDALLVKHIEMSTEIKSLDSDMQMLVYENYNKFISATDTIRSMKSNVDGMDANMQELNTVIESVAGRSQSVNNKLQQRRDHIEELNQVRGLLFKLQAVFDLPRRVRTALEQDAVEIAVDHYAEAAPLLKRYGHKGAIRRVAEEVDALARELSKRLKARLMTQRDDAADTIKLIRRLGEPVESLQEDFLQSMRARLEGILVEAHRVVEAVAAHYRLSPPPADLRIKDPAGWGFEGETPPGLQRFVVELDQRFLTELAQTAALFEELFEAGGRKRLIKVVKRSLSEAAAFEAASTAGVPMDAAAQHGHHGRSGSPSLRLTSPALQRDWGSASLADALYTISNDITRLQRLLPELSPQDRGVEIVEGVVRLHIGNCFSCLERRAISSLADVRSKLRESAPTEAPGSAPEEQPKPLAEAFTALSELVERGAESILQGMRVYTSRQWVLRSWQDVFVDLVQGQLQHMFLSLLSGFLAMAGLQQAGMGSPSTPLASHSSGLQGALKSQGSTGEGPPQPASPSASSAASDRQGGSGSSEPPPTGLVLLLAKLCEFLESQGVAKVMEVLAAVFPGQGAGSGGEQPPAFVAGEVARRLRLAAQQLLTAFVAAHGRRLSLAARRSVDSPDWLQHKEPRGPRPVCQLILERLSEAEAEAGQLLEDSGSMMQRPSSFPDTLSQAVGTSQAATSGVQSSALERNVARLFSERVRFSGRIEFTRSSVLAGVARLGLKSMVEGARLQTLGRAGLQQLQLDVHYLRQPLSRYANNSEGAALWQLLDEVLSAAMERSLEPVLLDPPVVERIMAAAPPLS
ncbi:hypothetical protein WJX74_004288 [Apatococcus lobatus]|uniref:Vacuolar protein sorting-associated protein 51 homolog n=1 Tax=Apatococcus lobatus TaxID=904363 RepID=A0AAW1QAH0_9CHLO